jgi:flagellin-like protein
MNNIKELKNRKAISPIIATLLLILIAIAAGVIVYAYVTGFIGNSTGNSGANINTISLDQVYLSSSTSSFPVTAFLRNQGPSVESLDVGFYVKSSAINSQLAPAVSLTAATPAHTITVASVALAEASATTITVTVSTTACTATTDEVNVNGFGASQQTTTGTCTVSGAGTLTATLTLTGGLQVSTSPAYSASASGLALSVTGSSANIVGVSTTTGTLKILANSVGDLTLAQPGKQTANPLSSGSTYTVQITGTDGATTSQSAKST